MFKLYKTPRPDLPYKRAGLEYLDNQKRPATSSENGNPNIKKRPLQVGKASIHDPKIPQPRAAEAGVVPKVPFRLLLSGASGSGKTNVARWLLDKHYVSRFGAQKSWFDRIVLFSPTAKVDPVWKNLKGLAESDRIVDVSPSRLRKVLNDAEQNVKRSGKERGKHTLVILDDVIAESKFINSPEFLTAFIRFRHFLGSIIVMTQSYVKVPRSARIQATHVIMFPSQPTEVERLYSEYGPYNMRKKEFYNMIVDATTPNEQEPFPFVYIDRHAPLEKRFRRNLDITLTAVGTKKGDAMPESKPIEEQESESKLNMS